MKFSSHSSTFILGKASLQFLRIKSIFISSPHFRSSRQRYPNKKSVLRNFTKFTGKHMCQNLFFNKVAGVRLSTSLKKRLWHRCFPVDFVKFLRTPFLQNTSGRLLLSLPLPLHNSCLITTKNG